nr:carbohydrate-binding protein [uncultured Olsenella sp.]
MEVISWATSGEPGSDACFMDVTATDGVSAESFRVSGTDANTAYVIAHATGLVAKARHERELAESTPERQVVAIADAVKAIGVDLDKLDDGTAVKATVLFDEWEPGVRYATGKRLQRFMRLYRVRQEHTSQPDWEPADTPALYERVLPGQDGTAPGPWEPQDGSGGYGPGNIVTHKGFMWRSTFAGKNTWEPGVQGTEAVWEKVGPAA